MKNLKNILRYSIIWVLAIVALFFRVQTIDTYYHGEETKIEGILWSYQIDGNQLKAEIKAKEKILVQYYFTSEQEKLDFEIQYHLGDWIEVHGSLKFPSSNRNFHLFNYQKYLKSKKIFWVMEVDEIIYKHPNRNIFFTWKEWIYQMIDQQENAMYLKYLLLGNSTQMESDFLGEIQLLGISHLFAISGMHIHLLIGCLLWILKKITKIKWFQLPFIIAFLLFYSFLTDFSPSVVRASLFFVLLFIKNMCNKSISSLACLVFIFIGMLLYNPYYCYHVGFIFSFTISFSLLYFSRYQKKQSYLKRLFQTSWISFLMGMSVLMRNFFQVNFLTPIWNLFFVPFVSLLLFPMCIFCLFCPFLNPILNILILILKWTITFGNQITFLQFSFSYISYTVIIGYWFVIIIIIRSYLKGNYKLLIILPIILFFHYHIAYLNPYPTLTMIDVGQGDSILLVLPHNQGNILIDTGGAVTYEKEEWKQKKKEYSIADSILIPYLQSIGIHHLDYLILTHGDVDHMGESIDLVENFKVDKVIFNCGPYNDLENGLINVLDTKKIEHYSCIKELNIDNNKLYFLNTKAYDNENDNSSVIYTELNGHKLLLMGDAGLEKEKNIIDKYNIKNIDILKVGHHGSNTSSSKEFIDEISPKVSIISVGKNNKYGHPKSEVLDTLSNSKIYRTDQNGSIEIQLKKNGYKIRTCNP